MLVQNFMYYDPQLVYDFTVKVMDLEFLYCNFLQFHFFFS